MPQPLPDDAIARELAKLAGWSREGGEIVRTYDRGNFNGSIAFVNAIAAAANAADHHPDIAIAWNRVTVRLSSHDARGLTERDFALARTIDGL
ncbi:MAG TPA: 4a-hydroxytetrahydrobiopterin dehydratase [Candidatus Lustribacter sp.]|jgi:4a-hydroxytetrahydrobiopterin dehydratase|nr:4a-hydroxytetrahydrobiopterin dehydratase [Candidatus Lustribacter sp.]